MESKVAGTSRGTRQSRRDATRAELIRTSTRMFQHAGYDSTTLGAIADEVGISVPTLLTYFPSKEHLVLAREFDIRSAFEASLNQEDRIEDTLELWSALNDEYISSRAGPLEVFGRRLHWMATTPSVSKALLGLCQSYAETFERGFRADYGRLSRETTVRVACRASAAGLAFGHFSLLTQWALEGSPDDLADRTGQLIAGVRGWLPATAESLVNIKKTLTE